MSHPINPDKPKHAIRHADGTFRPTVQSHVDALKPKAEPTGRRCPTCGHTIEPLHYAGHMAKCNG